MKLLDIKIRQAAIMKPQKSGDFLIRIILKDAKNGKEALMLIPKAIYELIIFECNAMNAQTAMEYLHSHQQTIGRLLQWKPEEIAGAFQKLLAHVHSVLNLLSANSIPRTKE